MRYFKLFPFLFLLFLCSCSSPSSSAEASLQPETAAPSAAVIWVKEPSLGLDTVHELQTVSYVDAMSTTFNERIGYPPQWDDCSYPNQGPEAAKGYSSNALAVISEGKAGVYDYEGHVLLTPSFPAGDPAFYEKGDPISYAPGLGFFVDDYQRGIHGCLSTDFRSFLPQNNLAYGIGGDPGIGYAEINGDLVYGYELSDMKKVEGAIEDAHGHDCLVRMIDPAATDYFSMTLGYAGYDSTGKRIAEYKGLWPLYYVNGFCTFSDQPSTFEGSLSVNRGKRALYNTKTGEAVTDFLYEDAKWFSDGYCPVSKDGKWGFIDETGKEVTDFLWDDVSALYEGKAYVGINGTYGILDLKATLENAVPLTMESCYPQGIPEAQKIETAASPDGRIGSLKVTADNLNSRSLPSTEGEKLEKAWKDSTYPVYEIQTDEQYTWYRIGEARWVADKNGEWVEYTAY